MLAARTLTIPVGIGVGKPSGEMEAVVEQAGLVSDRGACRAERAQDQPGFTTPALGRLRAGEIHRAAVSGRADRRSPHAALDLDTVDGAQEVVEIVEEQSVLRRIVEGRTVEGHADARLLDPTQVEVGVVGPDARIRVPV